MVGALLYVLVLAPALDFLPSTKVPAVYHKAVAELAKLPVCNEDIIRPVKDHGLHRSDLDGGDRLVRPVHERRVPIEQGYAEHFHKAKTLSFPFADRETRAGAPACCCNVVVMDYLD